MKHQIEPYVPSLRDRYYGRAYWKTPQWKRYGQYPYWDFYRRTRPTTVIVKETQTPSPTPSIQPASLDMYDSLYTKNMLLMMMSLIMVVLLITIIVLYRK